MQRSTRIPQANVNPCSSTGAEKKEARLGQYKKVTLSQRDQATSVVPGISSQSLLSYGFTKSDPSLTGTLLIWITNNIISILYLQCIYIWYTYMYIIHTFCSNWSNSWPAGFIAHLVEQIPPVSRRSWVRILLEPQIFFWALFVTA